MHRPFRFLPEAKHRGGYAALSGPVFAKQNTVGFSGIDLLHHSRKAACMRPFVSALGLCIVERRLCFAFSRPGSDLLSRVLRRSTIGAGVFHGRVRNGNGWGNPAMTTRSAKGKTMRRHGFVSVCLALANLSCSACGLARVPKRPYGHVCHALHVVSRSWI